MRGSLAQEGKPVKLDLKLTSSGGHAQITLARQRSSLVRINDTVYLKSTPTLQHRLARANLHVPNGRWLQVPADGELGAVGESLDMRRELTLLLSSSGKLKKLTATLPDGQRVVELTDTGRKLSTPTIYIPAVGTPYPIKITKRGLEHGEITFADWNDQTAPTPPANALRLDELSADRR